MNKARKRFVLFTELIIILLLTCFLTTINVWNFAKAAEDADILTEYLIGHHHSGGEKKGPPEEKQSSEVSVVPTSTSSGTQTDGEDKNNTPKPFHLDGERWGKIKPGSPDMNSSLRYFIVSIDKDGEVKMLDYRMSAVTETEAEQWADSLTSNKTGWTNFNYRYRVYSDEEETLVAVVDQARELWPCYRIMWISLIGGVIFILISLVLSILIGRKLFKPIEETDRKQKLFIAKLEKEFKMPLTIINADTEILERQNGHNPQTQSINKQVRRMTRLVRELGALTVFEEPSGQTRTNISDLLIAMLENSRKKFEEKNIILSYEVAPDITMIISDEAVKNVFREMIANSLAYSVKTAHFSLQMHHDRIKLVQSNDTTLPNGSCDQIFDRFTTLQNAEGMDTAGLGLAYVKEVVKQYNGRLSASVKNGSIFIEIDL